MAVLTTSYQLIASKYIGDASSTTTKNVYLRIYAKYTSQSLVDNKSYVSYKSVLYVDGGGTYFYTGNTTTKSLSGTGATSKSGDAQGNYYLGETTLSEITGTVTHGSTGAASVSITAGWVSAPWGINGSLSASADLPTIHRATTPTLSTTSLTIDSSVNITLTPANSTFKHRLRFDFGGITGAASGFSIGAEYTAQGNTTVTFIPPSSLGNQIPNNVSGTGQIICYTYTSSGTHIGTTYVPITVSVPAYNPTIKDVTITGHALLNGTYVQGISYITVNGTAQTAYGAGIKSVTSVIDGKSYSWFPITTSPLSSGRKTVQITVVDTRNRSTTIEMAAIQVYEYSVPVITQFALERQSDGTTVIATVQGSISPINNINGRGLQVTLGGVTNTVIISSYTVNATTTFTGVSTEQTLSAKAVLADSLLSSERTATLPTVAVTMDFHHSGKGIAMGKVAERENLFECAWDVQTHGTIQTSEYAKLTGYNYLGIVDLNTLKEPGMYGVYNSTNAPTSDIATLEVVKYSPDWIIQRFTTVGIGRVYIRSWRSGTTWEKWVLSLDESIVKDYIFEQGLASDGWFFRKWYSGVAECWRTVQTTTGTFSGTSPAFYCTPGERINYPTGLFTSVSDVQMTVASNGGGVITAFNCSGLNTTHCEPGYMRLYGGSSSLNVSVSMHIMGGWN